MRCLGPPSLRRHRLFSGWFDCGPVLSHGAKTLRHWIRRCSNPHLATVRRGGLRTVRHPATSSDCRADYDEILAIGGRHRAPAGGRLLRAEFVSTYKGRNVFGTHGECCHHALASFFFPAKPLAVTRTATRCHRSNRRRRYRCGAEEPAGARPGDRQY